MSLIIDALKKAQQLRRKGGKETPFFSTSGPAGKRAVKPWWVITGALCLGLLIFLFVFWRSFFTPPPPALSQKVLTKEKRPSFPKIERSSPGSPIEIQKVEPGQERKELSSSTPLEKEESVKEFSLDKKERQPIAEPPATKKKAKKVELVRKDIAQEKPIPPSPSPKENSQTSLAGVEEKGKRELILNSEILTHFNSGVQSYQKGETLKAIGAYQKVIELNPFYVEAYNNLGIIYQEIGDLESALRNYQKAVEINPGYEKGLNNLGILFYLRGEYEKASEVFQKALSVNPNHIESYLHLGTLYKKQGKPEKAMEAYQKALHLNPFYGEVHYNLGILYEEMKDRESAIHHYQQFVQLSQKSYPDLALKVQRRIIHLTESKRGKKE